MSGVCHMYVEAVPVECSPPAHVVCRVSASGPGQDRPTDLPRRRWNATVCCFTL